MMVAICGLLACAAMHAQEARVEIPCPVMLVSGHVRGGNIELSFRNKGKVPIQQVSLGCSPAMAGRARDAICHTESGLFYPGTPYTMTFAYTGARRGAVTLSVKGARLGTGEMWMARSARACRPIVVRK